MKADLRFSTDTVIIPEDNAISVLNRRGIVTIRARNIDRLHRVLQPYINGTHDEAALLMLLPQHLQSVTRDYLRKLEDANAIVRESCFSTDTSLPQYPACYVEKAGITDKLTLSGTERKPSFVSFKGPVREMIVPGIRHLCFVTRKRMARELLRAGRRRHEMIYVGASRSNPNGKFFRPELEQCTVQARWLLSLRESADPTSQSACFYEWDNIEGSLQKVVEIASNDQAEISSIPRRIDLIHMVDVNQRPLVCLRAHQRFFPSEVLRFGVRYDSLWEELVLEFIAQILLDDRRSQRLSRGRTTVSGKRMGGNARLPVGNLSSWAVAPSQLTMRARALELHARQRSGKIQKEESVDVLTLQASHSEVTYLQKVLRLRFSSLAARLVTTADGYIYCEASGRRTCSLIREKALRDLLLALTWDAYYGSSTVAAPQLGYDFDSFVESPVLKELVRAKEAVLSQSGMCTLLSFHTRAWGRRVWIGRVEVG